MTSAYGRGAGTARPLLVVLACAASACNGDHSIARRPSAPPGILLDRVVEANTIEEADVAVRNLRRFDDSASSLRVAAQHYSTLHDYGAAVALWREITTRGEATRDDKIETIDAIVARDGGRATAAMAPLLDRLALELLDERDDCSARDAWTSAHRGRADEASAIAQALDACRECGMRSRWFYRLAELDPAGSSAQRDDVCNAVGYGDTGNPEQCIELSSALAPEQLEADWRIHVARAMVASTPPDQAELEEAAALEPPSAYVFVTLARLYDAAGDAAKACDAARRASRAADPPDAFGRDVISFMLTRRCS